jgi:hypothetical protein
VSAGERSSKKHWHPALLETRLRWVRTAPFGTPVVVCRYTIMSEWDYEEGEKKRNNTRKYRPLDQRAVMYFPKKNVREGGVLTRGPRGVADGGHVIGGRGHGGARVCAPEPQRLLPRDHAEARTGGGGEGEPGAWQMGRQGGCLMREE